jgi:hypothetical protein
MMRARVWRFRDAVFLRYWSGSDYVTREFRVTSGAGGAGWVSEYAGRGVWRQVCGRLRPMGWCLRCRPDDLVSVVRREYRAMRRESRRESAAWSLTGGV